MIKILFIANLISIMSGLFICKKNTRPIWFKFLTILMVFYVLIVLFVNLYGMYLNIELNSFDLNGDGIFSEEESTPAQQKAMSLVVNDAGRNMIYITGIINALLGTLFVCIVHFVVSKLKFFIQKNS